MRGTGPIKSKWECPYMFYAKNKICGMVSLNKIFGGLLRKQARKFLFVIVDSNTLYSILFMYRWATVRLFVELQAQCHPRIHGVKRR